jgi:hypothetical protein
MKVLKDGWRGMFFILFIFPQLASFPMSWPRFNLGLRNQEFIIFTHNIAG